MFCSNIEHRKWIGFLADRWGFVVHVSSGDRKYMLSMKGLTELWIKGRMCGSCGLEPSSRHRKVNTEKWSAAVKQGRWGHSLPSLPRLHPTVCNTLTCSGNLKLCSATPAELLPSAPPPPSLYVQYIYKIYTYTRFKGLHCWLCATQMMQSNMRENSGNDSIFWLMPLISSWSDSVPRSRLSPSSCWSHCSASVKGPVVSWRAAAWPPVLFSCFYWIHAM